MSVISNAFKIGNLSIDKRYTLSKAEIESLGDAAGYPDVFPIWCKDTNELYVFYRTTDGVPNVANFNKLVNTGVQLIVYPNINKDTSEISWEIKEIDGTVPEPVTLVGKQGKSAYETWKELGNTGTKQDFINNLIDLTNLTNEQVDSLKTVLGINDINTKLDEINNKLNTLLG